MILSQNFWYWWSYKSQSFGTANRNFQHCNTCIILPVDTFRHNDVIVTNHDTFDWRQNFKALRQKKGNGARKLVAEFLNKTWTLDLICDSHRQCYDSYRITGNTVTHTGNAMTHKVTLTHASALTHSISAVTHAGNAVTNTGDTLTHAGSAVTHSVSTVTHSGNTLTHTGYAVSHTGNAMTHTGNILTHAFCDSFK